MGRVRGYLLPHHSRTDPEATLTLYRFASTSATGRGVRWRLTPVPDAADAPLGRTYPLLGPVLDTAHLIAEDRARLLELAAVPKHQLGERAADLADYLGSCPRVTVPGLDLDVDDPALSFPLAERLTASAAKRGIKLRWALSGGDNGRLHLEPGPLEAPHPLACLAAETLWGDLCAEVGLVARGGDRRFWTDPSWPKGAGCVDLSPCHKAPSSKGNLFRALGGLYKDGRRRKRLVPGRPRVAGPIPAAALAPYLRAEEHARTEAADRTPRRRRPRGGVAALPGAEAAAALPLVARLLARATPPAGAGHACRLAVNRVLLERGVSVALTASVVSALARSAEGSEAAVENAQDTLHRLRTNGICAGLPTLRRNMGEAWAADLLEAVYLDLHQAPPTLGGLLASRGRIRGREGVPMLRRAEALGREALAVALRRALTCGRIVETAHDLTQQGEPAAYSRKLRCENPLCGCCSVLRTERIEEALRDMWKPLDGQIHAFEIAGLKDDAELKRVRLRLGYGLARGRLRLIRSAGPEADLRWTVFVCYPEISADNLRRHLERRLAQLMPDARLEGWEGGMSAASAARRAARAWISLHLALERLRRAGDEPALAEAVDAWRGRRRVAGPREERGLPWPTRAILRQRAIDLLGESTSTLVPGEVEYRLARVSDPEAVLAVSEHPWSIDRAAQASAVALGFAARTPT